MTKIDGASPLIPAPSAKPKPLAGAEAVVATPPTQVTPTEEIDTRSSLELEGPTQPATPADQALGGLTLPLLLQQMQLRITAIEKSGSTTEVQELYQRCEPIVQALRQSMEAIQKPAPPAPPAPAKTEVTLKPHIPYSERNQAQIRRFELLYKHLDLNQFSALLGFSGEPSKAVHSVFLRLGRDVYTWADLTHALESSNVKVASYRALASYQAQIVLNAQPTGSTLFIASQPKDASAISLTQEKELLKMHFEHESFFALENPDPAEIDGFIQSGRFSQVWLS
ncbi:MAG: hypothetical protein ACAI44_37620, partial [Candidatus Sericytochromatia bacterium]